ncbi:MBL fold metallo-hydrolase [Nocardia sp. NPDC051990]|uniref:MBL fold metallo-hydrolase n=1 Tax=Nocardia sp. NPDC051990 TaxID=3155285 RepID=UPI00342B4AA3
MVDTGYGEQAVIRPEVWVGRQIIRRTKPVLDQVIARHVEDLGFAREDVRDIIVTHLDLDHAGGLADFPEATVHVYSAELDAMTGATDVASGSDPAVVGHVAFVTGREPAALAGVGARNCCWEN